MGGGRTGLMAIEEPPLTRSELRAELREELDRTLRHYAG